MSARNGFQTTTTPKIAKPAVGTFSWGITNPFGLGGTVAATYSTAVTELLN
jgi:hypothetical protein